MSVSTDVFDERVLQREVDAIARLLQDDGPLDRRSIAEAVRARYWGPGRFRLALREAMAQGKVRLAGRGRFAAAAAIGSGERPVGPGYSTSEPIPRT